MILTVSLLNLLRLDSDYPTDADASEPGISRGTCSTSSGVPTDVESNDASSSVTYSNIKSALANAFLNH